MPLGLRSGVGHVNQLLEQWIAEVADQRELCQFRQMPSTRFGEEKAHLQALPATDFDTSYFDIRHVAWDGYIEVRGNRYSVLETLLGHLKIEHLGYQVESLPAPAYLRVAAVPCAGECYQRLLACFFRGSQMDFRSRVTALSSFQGCAPYARCTAGCGLPDTPC